MSERGSRELPHTADVRFEAWAATREECVAEAITALVHTFVDPSTLGSAEPRTYTVSAATDTELLLEALDEVIFDLDVADRVPISATVRPDPNDATGLEIRCECGNIRGAELTGSVPKAVSWHELEIGTDGRGWRCRVTVDI